jgi:uncharacterized hydrophobic protein (TIGR00271 family)
VIELQVFGESAQISRFGEHLDELEHTWAVRVVPAARAGHSVVTAEVLPIALDGLMGELRDLGVPEENVTAKRVEVIGGQAAGPTETSVVWSDVLGQAWREARPIGRYLAFMFAAGVIACYGVTDGNGILIVGAMAVSPDLLPIVAVAVGLVRRNRSLVGRAFLTLAVGLGLACVAAAIFAFAQDQLDLIPSGFDLQKTGVLGSLVDVNDETIVVAFVAGAAGMLAFETRAQAAVGVAISVTTIPAAAYLGVAAGLGELDTASGALGVLSANVAMMVLGASAMLLVQRSPRLRGTRRARPSEVKKATR